MAVEQQDGVAGKEWFRALGGYHGHTVVCTGSTTMFGKLVFDGCSKDSRAVLLIEVLGENTHGGSVRVRARGTDSSTNAKTGAAGNKVSPPCAP